MVETERPAHGVKESMTHGEEVLVLAMFHALDLAGAGHAASPSNGK